MSDIKELVNFNNIDYSKAKIITTSLKIAEKFGKEHKNVLKDIRELDCSKNFAKLNFELTERDVKNIMPNGTITTRKEPYYNITRDGFMFLAMGYRGKTAAKFKEDFIREFNRRGEELMRWNETRTVGIKMYRRPFTDVIQCINSGEPVDDFIKFSYGYYTDLIYKKLFNKTAKQLRIERDFTSKQNIRNCLTEQELMQVQDLEEEVRKECIKNGWIKLKPNEAYQKVKNFLEIVDK